MQDYYYNLKKELFTKWEQLRTLTRQSKIQGDSSEALIREFLARFIADKFAVKHGILYDDKGKSSQECDIIIYEKSARLTRGKPSFSTILRFTFVPSSNFCST